MWKLIYLSLVYRRINMKTVSAFVLAVAILTRGHCQELNNRPIIGECGHVSRVRDGVPRVQARLTTWRCRPACCWPSRTSWARRGRSTAAAAPSRARTSRSPPSRSSGSSASGSELDSVSCNGILFMFHVYQFMFAVTKSWICISIHFN